MGDDTEWMKLPTDEKVQHKVYIVTLFYLIIFCFFIGTFSAFWLCQTARKRFLNYEC